MLFCNDSLNSIKQAVKFVSTAEIIGKLTKCLSVGSSKETVSSFV